MNQVIQKVIKKSKIQATTDFDFYQITRKSSYLLECKIERELDSIYFNFDCDEVQMFSESKLLSSLQKYRLLINVSNMIKDIQRLKISLHPNNLMFDSNLIPKAMIRDIYGIDDFNEQDFVDQYKSLIGYVLQNKYSFEDYYQGGNRLLSKNKETAIFTHITSLAELLEILKRQYNQLQEKKEQTLLEVDKYQYQKIKKWNVILECLVLVIILLFSYFGVFRLNEEIILKKADDYYIQQDYLGVKNSLKKVSISRMDIYTMYVLSISNVQLEALSEEQKHNILANISTSSDVRILQYWIYLGKSNFEKAIDIAKQIGNKEYIAYGYMKEKAQIENDQNLSGKVREEKLKAIEKNIDELGIGK